MASDFSAYMEAQEHTRRMFAEYNSASRGLEMAKVKERCAEVRSQSEPLKTLMDKLGIGGVRYEEARELLCGLAEYVVLGREARDGK
jgi:hypothetical protein